MSKFNITVLLDTRDGVKKITDFQIERWDGDADDTILFQTESALHLFTHASGNITVVDDLGNEKKVRFIDTGNWSYPYPREHDEDEATDFFAYWEKDMTITGRGKVIQSCDAELEEDINRWREENLNG